MPVYRQEEYADVLARIRQKLSDAGISMGPVLSEAEIAAYEEARRIRLPEAFRRFLLEVGDGCPQMLDGFPLRRLADMEEQSLSQPFQLEDPWVWEDDDSMSWDETIKAMETRLQGQLELIDTGCGCGYHLIVTGACRGEVWNFTDAGVQPCCERQDFLGWFELWLDLGDETDYLKDFYD